MREPIDSDVDLHDPSVRAELRPTPFPVLAAISAGGAIGALGRYGLSVALPHAPGGFPWSTFLVNVSGCLLIGVLMVLVTEVWTVRLLRPFLGVGVLGGYTTFSTYVLDIQQAMDSGSAGIALAYLAATLVAAVPAAWAGTAVTLRLVR
ncbi:putative fluoride ion transporter CrcB [Acrocarpospora corrugata]|uniref:Fluoride-specific ion channel FluC n=1 Tax=Acrocarpospora corrugata TaxID=35763 RepID=A0A5M3VZ32_9ACTN|nr:CrcB family protein [Acrocarpospora corrugata]GES01200.1 putative fluoride ion transporter CrcB [Acrocarpospora corrugata]